MQLGVFPSIGSILNAATVLLIVIGQLIPLLNAPCFRAKSRIIRSESSQLTESKSQPSCCCPTDGESTKPCCCSPQPKKTEKPSCCTPSKPISKFAQLLPCSCNKGEAIWMNSEPSFPISTSIASILEMPFQVHLVISSNIPSSTKDIPPDPPPRAC
jgi:hypothetical protein